MNLIKSIINGAVVVALGLTACTDDLIPDGNESGSSEQTDGIYISLNLSQAGAAGTRSNTTSGGASTDGTEVGRWYENEVNSVLLIFADEDDKIVAAFDTEDVEGIDNDNDAVVDYTYDEGVKEDAKNNRLINSQMPDKVYVKYKVYKELKIAEAEELIASNNLNLFVVCNPTSEIVSNATNESNKDKSIGELLQLVETSSVGAKPISINGNSQQYAFMMTNADFSNYTTDKDIYKTNIKGNLLTGKHNKKENAYPIKAGSTETPMSIGVQRSLARFDINESNIEFYLTRDGQSVNSGDDAYLKLSLEYFGLVNVSKTFNLFKEAGYNWSKGFSGNRGVTNKSGWDYFFPEVEKGSDEGFFVADPKYEEKVNTIETGTCFQNYFLTPDLFTNPSSFDRIGADRKPVPGSLFRHLNIENKEAFQKDVVTAGDNSDKGLYRIIDYCTPNTIHEVANQKNGISTGAVFMTKLDFLKGTTEGSTTETENRGYDEVQAESEVMRHECPIYAWNNVVYGVNRFLQLTAENPETSIDYGMRAAYNQAVSDRYAKIKEHLSDDNTRFDEKSVEDIQRDLQEYMVKKHPDQPWEEVEGGYDYGSYDFSSVKNENDRERLELYNDFLWFSAQYLTDEGNTGNDIEKRHRLYRVLPSKTLAEKLQEEGFSIILSSDPDGDNDYDYYVYYIYWNRHNDNGNNSVMGPMEFQVVRNNIYKLKVTGINLLGHPIPRPKKPDYPVDPDPLNPDTPDEYPKDYFNVEMKVVDWNVIVDDDIILGH